MFRALLLIAFVGGCDDPKAKISGAAKKADNALDKLDKDEAAGHLAKARAAVAAGERADEACSWVARQSGAENPDVVALRRVCAFEMPLARGKKAVEKAEKAKAEQPQAPSLTECSSDEWTAAKRAIDAGNFGGEAAWTELSARWAKVCPGP